MHACLRQLASMCVTVLHELRTACVDRRHCYASMRLFSRVVLVDTIRMRPRRVAHILLVTWTNLTARGAAGKEFVDAYGRKKYAEQSTQTALQNSYVTPTARSDEMPLSRI